MTTHTLTVVSTPVGGQALKGGLEYAYADIANAGAYSANATIADNSGVKAITDTYGIFVYIQTPVFTSGGVMYIPTSYTVVGGTNNTDNASGTLTGQGTVNHFKINVTPVTGLRQNLTLTITWVSLGIIGTFGYENASSPMCPICGCKSWRTDNLAANADFIICTVCGYQDTGRELTET